MSAASDSIVDDVLLHVSQLKQHIASIERELQKRDEQMDTLIKQRDEAQRHKSNIVFEKLHTEIAGLKNDNITLKRQIEQLQLTDASREPSLIEVIEEVINEINRRNRK